MIAAHGWTEPELVARIGRARLFGRLRPGLLRFGEAPGPIACILIFPPPLSCQLAAGKTLFALDVGAGVGGQRGDRGRVEQRAGGAGRPVEPRRWVLDEVGDDPGADVTFIATPVSAVAGEARAALECRARHDVDDRAPLVVWRSGVTSRHAVQCAPNVGVRSSRIVAVLVMVVLVMGSRPVVGSSKSIMSGWGAKARASASLVSSGR